MDDTPRKVTGVASVLSLLFAVGCSSGGGSFSDPTSDPPSPAVAEAMIEELMLPAVQVVGLLDPFAALARPAAAAAAVQEDGCNVGPCDGGGSFEVCRTGDTMAATLVDCRTPSLLTIDGWLDLSRLTVNEADYSCAGSWNVTIIDPDHGRFTLTGSTDTSWSGNLMTSDVDIRIGHLVLGTFKVAGGIASRYVGDCLQQDADALRFDTVGLATTTVGGSLTYCPGAVWPTGVRTLAILDARGDLLYELDFDASGAGTALVDVSDTSDGTALMVCHVDLDAFDATCATV